MFVLLDKTELETAQQFLDQASQQNLVCFLCIILFVQVFDAVIVTTGRASGL